MTLGRIPRALLKAFGKEPFGERATIDSCTCVECVSPCTFRPGWFLPGEAEALAEAMGIPFDELFRRFLRIDLSDRGDETGESMIAGLAPAVKAPVEDAGKISADPPYGVCTFLTGDMRCAIHALGKPFECRMALGHDSNGGRDADAGPDHGMGEAGRPPADDRACAEGGKVSAKGARRLGGSRIKAMVGDLAIYPDANHQWSIGRVAKVDAGGEVKIIDTGCSIISGSLPEAIVAPASELTATARDVVTKYVGLEFPSPADIRLVLDDEGVWRPGALARPKITAVEP
jgi:hypothetical protein